MIKNGKSKKLRIAVMGGTFDPIHYGHLVTAAAVLAEFSLEQVIFIPTGNPAHKDLKYVSNAEQRYLMTVLATTENPKFAVSRMEIDRIGITYTIDTIKELRNLLGDETEIFFITGADAINQILTWRDAEELLKLCNFVAVTRPGYLSDELYKETEKLKVRFASKLFFLEVPALAISSTDIRNRVSLGKPITYLLPDIVEKHIQKIGLYKDFKSETELKLDAIKQKVRDKLSEKRFSHILGVEETAIHLAKIHGVDEYQARLAAILHDYAKEIPSETKKELCKKYKIKLDDVMKKQLDLTHSFLSAELAKNEFGIIDEDVLNAIRYHTTARTKMSLLEKIIYIADLIEPYREDYEGLDEIKEASEHNLSRAVELGLLNKIEYTTYRKKLVHPLSIEALNYLKSLDKK